MVYNDASRRPDPSAFTKLELWHSDVTTTIISIWYHDMIHYFNPKKKKKQVSYEIQPPSTTSLKLITCPEVGGDTLWSSG